MERRVKLEIGEFYHVYNRGVEKRIIFKNSADYKRFLVLLYIANSTKSLHIKDFRSINSIEEIYAKDRGEQLVAIGAYCLMPNHFHLLLTPLVESGVSKFMLKLQTGYSMYFNKKNNRVGSLFQGTFKSQHINKNRYLMHIYSYIHLNPSKLQNPGWKNETKNFLKTIKNFITTYPYSSLQEYLSGNYRIIDPKKFPINKKDVSNYNFIIGGYHKEFSFVEPPSQYPEDGDNTKEFHLYSNLEQANKIIPPISNLNSDLP
jgi:putative transposase